MSDFMFQHSIIRCITFTITLVVTNNYYITWCNITPAQVPPKVKFQFPFYMYIILCITIILECPIVELGWCTVSSWQHGVLGLGHTMASLHASWQQLHGQDEHVGRVIYHVGRVICHIMHNYIIHVRNIHVLHILWHTCSASLCL